MADQPPARPPVLVPFDLEEVDRLLLAAARAMAYDVNTSLVWRSDEESLLHYLAGPLQKTYARLRYGTYAWEGPGSLHVDTNGQKVVMDTGNFQTLFRTNFLRFAAQGPQPALNYLHEKIHHTERSWLNMRERFKMAQQVNDEVTAELNRSKALTRFFMVAGNVSMTVLGAVAPIHWVLSSLAGVGYSLTCQFANSVGEAASGDLVGFQKPDGVVTKTLANSTTAASLTNAAVSTGFNYAQGRHETFLEAAEAASTRLEQKLREYTAQRGADLTRPQRKIVERLGREAGGIGAQSNAAQAARRLSQVKGASIVVGLLFMKDDFKALLSDACDVVNDWRR